MKKILAILLILAMLVPMGMVAQAAEPEIKPFYMVNWDTFDPEYSNVYEMPYFWVNEKKIEDIESCTVWPKVNSSDLSVIAAALKEAFDEYPEGARYFNYTFVGHMFLEYNEDAFFMDTAIAKSQQWLHLFLKEYKSIGGKLDGIVIDIEYLDSYAYYIGNIALDDPLIYDKIVKNPNYAEKIRPELEARGFKFYPNVTELTPEIYSINSSTGKEYERSREIWDAVTHSYVNECKTEACAPLWEYYPNAELSDYQTKTVKAWVKGLSGFGTVDEPGGNVSTTGTSSNENYYSIRPYSFFTDTTGQLTYKTLPGYNKAHFEDKTFNYFLYESNVFKSTYQAAENGAVTFWIAHYMYNLVHKNSPSLTPYYTEQLFHLGLLNPQVFQGYIIENEIGNAYDYELCLDIVNDALVELTRMVGAADRTPINVTTNWNSSFVLSGMTAGGKNVWRLTPDNTLGDLESFQVTGATDPTFKIGAETITFPGGKIIADGKISGLDANENEIENNTFGYWIETATDVIPVVTREANYHIDNPAFGENYESYEIGTEYNFKNALPATSWEVKTTGDASATVVADPSDGDNKVLALQGNVTIKNVNMPKNITAGDSYAENQAWSVEMILPSDVAENAEVVLLNGASDKKKSDDGGFQILGNKVYYSQEGEYIELSGVTLTPGSKYRFVRDMDFNDADAFACDYYVYDATGALLGSAKDVLIGALDIPVASIGLRTTGVTGEAVLLDNFKLYPTKVGYDFELYDEKTGTPVTDLETPRAGNTAYHLSWLNATNKDKTYTMMAAIYEGDKLVEEKVIKEIKMTANFEGVDFGVVEIAEGQTVRVYLRNDNPADEDDDGIIGGKSGGISTSLLIMLIITIILATAAISVVVLTGGKNNNGKKPAK